MLLLFFGQHFKELVMIIRFQRHNQSISIFLQYIIFYIAHTDYTYQVITTALVEIDIRRVTELLSSQQQKEDFARYQRWSSKNSH